MNESSKKLLILKIPPKKNITLASIQSQFIVNLSSSHAVKIAVISANAEIKMLTW